MHHKDIPLLLISIRPEFVEEIRSGRKRYEYRKTIFRDADVRRAVIYETMPVGRVVGEFRIDDVLCMDVDELWERTKEHSGISEEFFRSYFRGKEKGYAIEIGSPRFYGASISLKDIPDAPRKPPQSFGYIPSKESLRRKRRPEDNIF